MLINMHATAVKILLKRGGQTEHEAGDDQGFPGNTFFNKIFKLLTKCLKYNLTREYEISVIFSFCCPLRNNFFIQLFLYLNCQTFLWAFRRDLFSVPFFLFFT